MKELEEIYDKYIHLDFEGYGTVHGSELQLALKEAYNAGLDRMGKWVEDNGTIIHNGWDWIVDPECITKAKKQLKL